MTLTPEQQAVVDLQLEPGEAAKVIAYAGSGKTTTLVNYAETHEGRTLYLAFNKSVEQEAKNKFPISTKVKTVHALAFASVGCRFEIGNLHYFNVAKVIKADVYVSTLVCHTLENWWNSADSKLTVEHAADDLNKMLAGNYKERLVGAANSVWDLMVNGRQGWKMTHNGYLKLFQLSKPDLNMDTVLLDEAQDTNPVTQAIVNRQRSLGTSVVYTGDRFQQIYSWRGAVDAMQKMEGATRYLTQSFRFGPALAKIANVLLSEFYELPKPLLGLEAVPTKVGAVDTNQKHTVLTRSNAELFRRASKLAVGGVPFAAGGSSFQDYLDVLLDLYCIYSRQPDKVQAPRLKWFKTWAAVKDYASRRLDHELASKISLIEAQGDSIPVSVETIRKRVVQDEHAHVTLSTAHRAKGMEWDNVVLANDYVDLLDESGTEPVTLSETVGDGHVHPDEINLIYVAMTRARRNLSVSPAMADFFRWVGAGANPSSYAPAEAAPPPSPVADDDDDSRFLG